MPAKRKAASPKDSSTATIGFEAKLWLAADKLRNNMDAAEPSGASWTTIGSPEGWRGGANQFYTPSSVVRSLVAMLALYTALRDSAKPISEPSRREFRRAKHHRGNFSIHGQQSSVTTLHLDSLPDSP